MNTEVFKFMKLTVAQALIRFLDQQYVERDGVEHKFFAGCFGIFGHGNVGGIGQALFEYPEFKYFQARNEQAMVHTAVAYSRMKNRLSAFACTSSIGPGATNMLTGAALATINRIPVLLLPGDIFATRHIGPVLQQLEDTSNADASVNDAFRPLSKFWDRINRPEQLMSSLLQAMRVLTSPADTGAVTLCLPQDVQAESFDFPENFFRKRVWFQSRALPDSALLLRAANLISEAKKPMIIAGGGVIYSEATSALTSFCEATGIPAAETFAGKGSLRYNHPLNLGAAGATGTEGANAYAAEADLVIGVGTRYSDFTMASHTAFQNPDVKFININIAEFDAYKQSALPLSGDARATLQALQGHLEGFSTSDAYRKAAEAYNLSWDKKVSDAYAVVEADSLSQAEVIGAVNSFAGEKDVMVCAAGSMPGDLHKLWRCTDPKNFHMEYGYSCMGYEIAGGLGVKLADPDREVFVMVGDGSYLMMATEIVTAVQEGLKLIIVLINNHGYASIGGLSKSLGSEGFGTQYRYRGDKHFDGEALPYDLATNAESLGATVIRTSDEKSFQEALVQAKKNSETTVIYIETPPERKMAGYGHAWWEVPVSSVSQTPGIQEAFAKLTLNKKRQKWHL
jgi:3D-(3,5/4)-trihydroxycyclohexane-1,2-dione acylhydrolase (decyclizing)